MISNYIRELEKIKLLTLEEEQLLWTSYKTEGNLESRGKIIEHYQPLVFKEAMRYRHLCEDAMDLVQEGMVGLIEAAERFDPGREVSFSLFSIHRIRGRILDFLRKEGKKDSLITGSFDEDISWWETMPMEESSLEKRVEDTILYDIINEALGRLPQKEQLVMEQFYYADRPIKSIAKELDISESYISRLQRQGVKRLRGMLSRVRKEWKE